jgi:membrane fusion protein
MSPLASEPAPFLDPAPPPWAARALATVLLALFAVGIAALVLVQVPETVSAAFVVAPTRGNDPVRTLHAGTVARVNVQDAQAVEKGQVLFVLASEPVGDRAAERQTLDARIEGRSGRVANERQRYENRRRADEQEQQRLQQKIVNLEQLIALKQQQLTLSKEIAARMRQSLETGVSSWMDASKPQLEADRLASELQQIQGDLADSRNLLNRLTFEMASTRSVFDELQRAIGEEATGFKARKRVLDEDPARRDGSAVDITSPCSGTIVKLQVRNADAVVHEGDLLAEVSCAGERLQAELQLPERGMALLRVGQPVKLLYDAFPYERYGVHFGTLRWVSPASTAGPLGPSFRALAALDAETVGVEGQRRPVLAGMTGRAAVIVGRRSLASYAIEPLRQLRESISTDRPVQKTPS